MNREAQSQTEHEQQSITAALLDALCSPQLYEIVLRDGELHIRPRDGMHPQPVWQAAA